MKIKLLFTLLFIPLFMSAQFSDGFENYNLGPMYTQNTTIWSDWMGNYTDNPISVVDDVVYTGTKSGYVGPDFVTDAFLLLGNKSSGLWTLRFYMYIPKGKSGYFNIQSETSTTGGYQGGFISGGTHFNQNARRPGIGYDITSDTSFSFPHDTWFEIIIYFDLNNSTYQLKINNTVVNNTPTTFLNDLNILGAIDFSSGNWTTSYWIDEISFSKGVLSVQDNLLYQNISICPNPATNSIKVINKQNIEIDKIVIYNSLGKKILTTKTTNDIDISILYNGIYFIEISGITENKTTYKLIKK